MSSVTPAGRRGRMRSRLALAASITATVLAPDWRRTSRTTVGTPLRRANERCFLGAVLGAADVADADRRAVARRDHQVVELLGVGEAAHRAQRALVDVGRDVAAGQVGVLLLQRVADFGDRQLVGGEPIGFDPDAHRALEAADDLHLADAGRALERHLDDLVGDLGQLADREVARQRDRQASARCRCPA